MYLGIANLRQEKLISVVNRSHGAGGQLWPLVVLVFKGSRFWRCFVVYRSHCHLFSKFLLRVKVARKLGTSSTAGGMVLI